MSYLTQQRSRLYRTFKLSTSVTSMTDFGTAHAVCQDLCIQPCCAQLLEIRLWCRVLKKGNWGGVAISCGKILTFMRKIIHRNRYKKRRYYNKLFPNHIFICLIENSCKNHSQSFTYMLNKYENFKKALTPFMLSFLRLSQVRQMYNIQ